MTHSRLLVLVEDTTATREFWPVWRRNALEPLLTQIQSGALGVYELNLVAFASVDGQCDGLLRSATWTRDVGRFRQSCESLTFEGSGAGNALGEALMEAAMLTRCPGDICATHVLLCATATMGRLPVLYPLSSRGDRVHGLSILAHMITGLGLTVSIVTDRNSNGVLAKRFGSLVGTRMLKKCEELSSGRGCLMMIHPGWRHGYEVLFPEFKDLTEWTETCTTPSVVTDSGSSAKTFTSMTDSLHSIPPLESEKASQLPLLTIRNVERSPYRSFRKDEAFADAVDLASWRKPKDRTSVSWKEDDVASSLELCSCDVEFALERELLGLEERQESERDVCSEKESKVESSTSYCIQSPAHSTTKQRRSSVDVPDTINPFARSASQMPAPEDAASSSQTRRHAFEAQARGTLSSTASVSIEERESNGRKMEQKRALESTPFNLDTTLESNHQQPNADDDLIWTSEMVSQGTNDQLNNSYQRTPDHTLPYRQDHDMHEAKRLRTNYGRSGSKSLIKLPASTYPPQEWTSTSPFINRNQVRTMDGSRQPARLPPRGFVWRACGSEGGCLGTVMPSSGFGWNVEWSGPLFLAGPLVRQSEPKKLFDFEILCKRSISNLGMWPTELVVHNMQPKEQQRCPISCMINIKWESLTDMGRTFGKWLTENNMIAIVDLSGERSTRMIISVQDTVSYGTCQLVAGFQREGNR